MPATLSQIILCPYTTLFRSMEIQIDRLVRRARRNPPDDEILAIRRLQTLDLGISQVRVRRIRQGRIRMVQQGDRKSTRLNSSHLVISYAVFCLKKKNTASTN